MDGISAFPAFCPLSLAHRSAIEAITSRFPPYSDFIFSGLWAWNTDDRCAVAMLGANLVFRLKDYTSENHYYAFIGQDDVVAASATLLAHARETGLLPQLRLIPEEVIVADARLHRHFSVAADRDNFDYVYEMRDWAALPLPRFRTHRKMIKCCRARAEIAWNLLDATDPACQMAMNEVFARWEHQTAVDAGRLDHPEYVALQRLFAMPRNERVGAGGAFAGDRLAGFTIWEALAGGQYAVGHFQKADRAYKGLTSWQAHAVGQCLQEEGCSLFNAEQDLGIPGLRAHKLSLRPRAFLRKYTIADPEAQQ
ncbi:MAG: phosphatidylglycerol lysyltransferase domain-containing protein [Thermomicrobiales bacterium]